MPATRKFNLNIIRFVVPPAYESGTVTCKQNNLHCIFGIYIFKVKNVINNKML